MVYRANLRILESLTILDGIRKAAHFRQLIKDPECWYGQSFDPTTSGTVAWT